MELSFIANTGIQYHRLGEIVIDLSSTNIINAIRFAEREFRGEVFLEQVMYLPTTDTYVCKEDLKQAGYLDPVTGELLIEENQLNPNLPRMSVDDLLSINRIDTPIGPRRISGLEILENHWLPIPMFQQDPYGHSDMPKDWCRIRLSPVTRATTHRRKVYDLTIAYDTKESEDGLLGPRLVGAMYETYSFAGFSRTSFIQNETPDRIKAIEEMEIPESVYKFCNPNSTPWLNLYLQELSGCLDLNNEEPGSRLKYLVYYIYFLCFLHKLNIIPDVKVWSESAGLPISTNLIIDVGNSRTFGIVAEDPLNPSFSKSSKLCLTDIETGAMYDDAFDMRLCFKDERFGIKNPNGQFCWPSIVRLGKEAARTISASASFADDVGGDYNSHYSSPKRYLWDSEKSKAPWRFISEGKMRLRYSPQQSVYLRGISEQFMDDGTFTLIPPDMAKASNYSRSSLMTFCFIELLLQARLQINSFEFREHNDSPERKREITKIILTCPTAMPRQEQIILRQCMENAAIAIDRFYSNKYLDKPELNPVTGKPVNPTLSKVEIIPSIRDLKLNADNADLKKSWNYDEASCCQMVYMYSELRRYCGNVKEFFSLYGRRRNGEDTPSLTVASLDIGAGTSDIMICTYKDLGESISPEPLFWDSFHVAGDDLLKLIITDVILEPTVGFEESGIIARRLREEGKKPVGDTMYGFFGDTQVMGVFEQRRRKEFTAQVLIPVAYKLLALLRDVEQRRDDARARHLNFSEEPVNVNLVFDDLFPDQKPSPALLNAFATHFGFRFEEMSIPFSETFMNDIIRRQFELHLKKWAAMFSAYKCDIVLMGGRPCSLNAVYAMMKRFYPVSPNRLISLNKYRVGSWYLGATETGFSEDKKSMVAVGALISYLAETGRLDDFKLTTQQLKVKVKPTTEYFGIVGKYGFDKPFITPLNNIADLSISALPVVIGSKQLNVQGYTTQMMYVLDFDSDAIRRHAIDNIIKSRKLPFDFPESELDPKDIDHESGNIRQRLKSRVPLVLHCERDYYTDKELIKITAAEDSERNTLPRDYFKFKLQSWAEDESNWLDSGVFLLHINN